MFQKTTVSPDHEHSYLPLQNNATRTVFEPTGDGLFKMLEYMYMFCKCGTSLMVEIPKKKL